jgi:archaellum component FlaG (FlaF/FlaG flagellin family)
MQKIRIRYIKFWTVSLGAGASVEGKMLAVNNGAVNITFSVTNTGSSLTLVGGTSFAMFVTGIVSNALASTVNGNMGTRSGSVDASFICNCEWRFYTS